MTKACLLSIATQFRQAIVAAKEDKAFAFNDRMSGFPGGCCDDAADLFAHYLYHKYRIVSIRIDGAHHDGNPENNCGHSWQEIEGLIVDLKARSITERIKPLRKDLKTAKNALDRSEKYRKLLQVEHAMELVSLNREKARANKNQDRGRER